MVFYVHLSISHQLHINISFVIDIFLKKSLIMNFKLEQRRVYQNIRIISYLLVRKLSYENENHYFSFIDNEKTFTKLLFYGEERSLFMWNMITFLFIDFLATNYVLAAVITYLLNLVRITFFQINYKIEVLLNIDSCWYTQIIWSKEFIKKDINSKEFFDLIYIRGVRNPDIPNIHI